MYVYIIYGKFITHQIAIMIKKTNTAKQLLIIVTSC